MNNVWCPLYFIQRSFAHVYSHSTDNTEYCAQWNIFIVIIIYIFLGWRGPLDSKPKCFLLNIYDFDELIFNISFYVQPFFSPIVWGFNVYVCYAMYAWRICSGCWLLHLINASVPEEWINDLHRIRPQI